MSTSKHFDPYLSLASTRPMPSRARTVPNATSWERISTAPRQRSRRDNIPQFVKSYLDMRQPFAKPGLKKSHFIPNILHPKPSALPEAGAAVPASSLALLKRQRRSNATFTVSAELVGLSPEKKQNIRIKKTKKKKKRRTSKHKGISMSIGEPPWATTRDFVHWQNRIFKAELDKLAEQSDSMEREIAHPTLLKIRGSKVQKPESTLDFDALQILIGDIKDTDPIERARSRIRGCNATMQASSMNVLKKIANARIGKFGCQEPGLVTNKKILKFLKTKPRPRTPRVIKYTNKNMDALMEQRRKTALMLQEVDVDLETYDEEDEDETAGPFLTQVSKGRTQLLDNI